MLGLAEPALSLWGQGLQWPIPGEQIVTEWPRMYGEVNGELFEIKLIILLWGDDEQWKHASFELLFDIEKAIGREAHPLILRLPAIGGHLARWPGV